MAKKSKSAKKSPSKKKPTARKAKPAKARAKTQRLPGMEIPKDRVMDRICDGLADVRATLNEARENEKGLIQNALGRMQGQGLTVYKAHGVEIARVPGNEKLRVRTVDSDEGDQADRGEPGVPEPDASAGDVLDEGGEDASEDRE